MGWQDTAGTLGLSGTPHLGIPACRRKLSAPMDEPMNQFSGDRFQLSEIVSKGG
jgi:hypothetical protein